MITKKKRTRKKLEIKSRKNGWVVVEFIKALPGGRILIDLGGGNVVIRHNRQMRFHLTKIVSKDFMERDPRKKIRLLKARKKKKSPNKKRTNKKNFISRRSDLTKLLKEQTKLDLAKWKKKNRS